jgi:phosphate starvation-inducible PhoH-like protein
VITGDVSQIDLPKTQLSGLIDAERTLRRVDGVAITRLTSQDIVRHPLVARIVDAYDASRAQEAELEEVRLGLAKIPEPESIQVRHGLPKARAPRTKLNR